jgi:esterase
MTVELSYQIYGQGEPVMILHGLFGSGRNWSSIAKQLAQKYSVITVDLRNHGTSGHSESMNYPEMAEDIIALANKLELNQFHLIGHSMGGKTAMVTALLHPERINKLIIMDIAPVSYKLNHDELIDAMLGLNTVDIQSRTHADELLSDAIPEILLRQFLLQNLVKEDVSYSWRINLESIQQNHAELRKFPDEVETLIFNKPALFISGALSDFVKPEYVQSMAGYFPQHKHVVINDANHWIHADKPDDVLREINAFLGDDQI